MQARRPVIISIVRWLLVCLLLASPSQVHAISQKAFALTIFPIGVTGFSSIIYYLWKNSPAQRVRGYPENLTMGEYYMAVYGGAALIPAQDWTFSGGFKPPLKGLTARGVSIQPGVLGGLKFGHYFNALPWFGIETEMSYSKNTINEQRVSLSRPLPGGAKSLAIPQDRFLIWCMQTNLVARYGFLPDKEVPFGRLQPYVGIGPGFEIMYGSLDSSKNFAIATQAGIRYMATANIGVFLEYKFSYQFNVEYEDKEISPGQRGVVTYDVPNNRIVFGVAYHFKNLFGN
jgi:opacity protein-like surface antigen